jgi:hypothetical protein
MEITNVLAGVAVGDLERALAELAQRKVTAGPVSGLPAIVATAVVTGADGNAVILAGDVTGDG